ncbi:hypothetical protein CY34DRAFT_811309 [Suillus luteus UH-Slu-Lm8-n1]|uniref:Uncharacterized protein n=1 Tax=Suillus luteus UH-Slu-Lm8-n1 TaxID=930992 RepID=A0A0D0APX4_9AGAM|nr:hypothetical protein CY34DRAFT_811309 [Suillus luteus UH-Slu-Lm8-n1]
MSTMNEKALIHRSHIRTNGDIVSHTSTEEAIVESVLALSALNDGAHIVTIFRAVYNNEPSQILVY